MQRFFVIAAPPILLLLAEFFVATSAIGISVWPLPSHYSSGNKVLWIAEEIELIYMTVNRTVTFSATLTPEALNVDKLSLTGEQPHLR